MLRVTLAAVLRADDGLVCALNSTVRRSPAAAAAVGRLAAWLAGVEVLLMLALALAGRRDSAVRMLVAVGLVYLLSDGLGAIWPRQRPFARLPNIAALAAHCSGRQWAGLAGSVGESDPLVGVDPDQTVSRQLVDQLASIAEVAHTHRFAGG